MNQFLMSIAVILALAGFYGHGLKGSTAFSSLQSGVIEARFRLDTVPSKTIYRDLNTGETIDIWYDAVGMRTLNKKTGSPVEFYINTSTQDTVFGRGRFIVNSYVMQGDDGKWKLNDGKVKVDGDELKVKVGDQKLKIDGDEMKIKSNGGKVKSEDGELKVKSRDGKGKNN